MIPVVIEREVGLIQEDGYSWRSRFSGAELSLSESNEWNLVLSFYAEPTDGVITSIANVGCICLVSGCVELELYRLPLGFEPSVFNRNCELGSPEAVKLNLNQAIFVDGRRYAVRMRVNKPSIIIRLFSSHFCDFQWQFDPGLRAPKSISIARQEDTELESMLMAIASLRSPRHVELLRQVSMHRNHVLRWRAIQLLNDCDEAATSECLIKALDDPHPEIRNAAAQALRS